MPRQEEFPLFLLRYLSDETPEQPARQLSPEIKPKKASNQTKLNNFLSSWSTHQKCQILKLNEIIRKKISSKANDMTLVHSMMMQKDDLADSMMISRQLLQKPNPDRGFVIELPGNLRAEPIDLSKKLVSGLVEKVEIDSQKPAMPANLNTAKLAEKRKNYRNQLLNTASPDKKSSSRKIEETRDRSKTLLGKTSSTSLLSDTQNRTHLYKNFIQNKKQLYSNLNQSILEDSQKIEEHSNKNNFKFDNWKPKGRLLGKVSAISHNYDQFRMGMHLGSHGPAGSPEEASHDWYAGDVKIAISPDGSKFATGAADGSLKIWNTLDFTQKLLIHRPVIHFPLNNIPILKLEFISNDSLILMSQDGKISIYRMVGADLRLISSKAVKGSFGVPNLSHLLEILMSKF